MKNLLTATKNHYKRHPVLTTITIVCAVSTIVDCVAIVTEEN